MYFQASKNSRGKSFLHLKIDSFVDFDLNITSQELKLKQQSIVVLIIEMIYFPQSRQIKIENPFDEVIPHFIKLVPP